MKNFNIIIILITSLCLAIIQKNANAQVPQSNITIPELQEDVDLFNEMDIDSMLIGIGGDELIPAADIYSVWSNVNIHPYGTQDIKDTVPINLIGFTFPLTKFYRVNSEFGPRRNRYHYGIDLKIEVGDTVVSSLGGKVRITKDEYSKKGYGKLVIVRHFNGLETFYAHLDEVMVEDDQVVTAGEIIGLAGNTGRSTGPHLHYEIRYLGKPINPRDVINFDEAALKIHADTLLLSASNFIYPTKATKISSKTSTVAKNSSGKAKVWTVKKGETLGGIAAKTGISITKLRSLNKLGKNSNIKIGQRLKY